MLRPAAKCLLCAGPVTKVRDWTHQDIKRTYSRIAEAPYPDTFPTIDYEILRCQNCTLLFADPALPGNDGFYEWVTTTRNYYQEHRWEWARCVEMLKDQTKRSILEIGCGTGNFLSYVSEHLSNVKITGLDTSSNSVAKARERGLCAHCLTLEQYISENPSARFNLICAYHCVEHVGNPKSLIESMQRIILPDGWIVVSVPYSPTTREVFEWECLNLPPHHMTRWNKKSLDRLALEVGMSAEIETDEGDLPSLFSVKPLVWKFLSLTGGSSDRPSDYLRPVAHPISFMRLASFILARERICGKPAGDTALVTLRFSRGG